MNHKQYRMKKLLLSLLLALPLFGFAQKGMQGIGVGLGYGIGSMSYHSAYNESLGIIFKYEYNPYNRFGLSANLKVARISELDDFVGSESYSTPNRPSELEKYNEAVWELKDAYTNVLSTTFGLDFHYFLNTVRRLRPYVLVGTHSGFYSDWHFTWNVKVGLGLNWRLSYDCMLQVELPFIKNQYLDSSREFGALHYGREGWVIYYDGNYGPPYDGNWNGGTHYYGGSIDLSVYNYLLTFCPSINIVYTF